MKLSSTLGIITGLALVSPFAAGLQAMAAPFGSLGSPSPSYTAPARSYGAPAPTYSRPQTCADMVRDNGKTCELAPEHVIGVGNVSSYSEFHEAIVPSCREGLAPQAMCYVIGAQRHY